MSIYTEYFGLGEEPFSLAPDPRFLYGSEQHREALAHLLYGVRSGGGFVLLTGEVGTGKTTVFRCFLEELPPEVKLALVLHPRLSARELMAAVCDEFGIPSDSPQGGTKPLVDRINSFLLKVSEEGGRAVVVVDEAQNLSLDVLEELRLLTNLETNRRKLLQIVLIGQPELRGMLGQPAMTQVSQRIVARFHLGPLDKKEVGAFVRHRLATAGATGDIFMPSVYPRLYRLSRGIPRLINLICDRALLGAYAKGESKVTSRLIAGAAQEVLGCGNVRPKSRAPAAAAAALAAVLICVVLWQVFRGAEGGPETVVPAIASAVHRDDRRPNRERAAARDLPTARPPVVREEPSQGEQMGGGLSWLLAEAGKGDRKGAEKILLRLWQSNTPQEGENLCRAAAAGGLSCFEGTGGLEELRRMDRPALLRLPTGEGGEVFAVLAGLEGGFARLVYTGGEGRMKLRWFGSFTLLWEPPPGYDGDVPPGRRSDIVPWIREGLTRAGFPPRTAGEGSSYDAVLADRVRAFQISRGIKADSIIGPLTIIHLNAVLGSAGPRLKPEDA